MALFDRLKQILKGKKMQQRLDTVKNAYEEPDTEKESIKKATEMVIKLIEENPNMSAIDLLKRIQEEENLPNKILVETTKQLPEVRSEEAAVKVVEKLDISSKGIQEILEHVDVSPDAAQKIAKQIPNEEIQEQEMRKIAEQRKIEREKKRRQEEERKKQQIEKYKKQLKELYVKCEEKSTSTLALDLKRIRDDNNSDELEKIMIQIFARKSAIGYKHVGSAKIPTITSVIPAEELLEHNFSKIVKEEFEDIKDLDRYPGDKEYSEERLQKQILKEIAKNVARTYDELGIIDIPQFEAMTKISEEDEEFLKDQIKTYGGKIKNEEKFHRRVRGIKEYSEDDLIDMFRKMDEDEKEEYLEELKIQMKQGKKKKFGPELEQKLVKLHERMEVLTEEESLDILDETIENIEEIISEKETEEKDNNEIKKKGTTQSDDDEEMTH